MNSKQQDTLTKLSQAFATKRQDLNPKPEVVPVDHDGKVIVMISGTTLPFPDIEIGKQGGIAIPALRSYADPFEAAVIGDQLLTKQGQRDEKKKVEAQPKQEATAPAPSDEKAAFQTGTNGTADVTPEQAEELIEDLVHEQQDEAAEEGETSAA